MMESDILKETPLRANGAAKVVEGLVCEQKENNPETILTRQMFLGPRESRISALLSDFSKLTKSLGETGDLPATPENRQLFVRFSRERLSVFHFLAIELTVEPLAVEEPLTITSAHTEPK